MGLTAIVYKYSMARDRLFPEIIINVSGSQQLVSSIVKTNTQVRNVCVLMDLNFISPMKAITKFTLNHLKQIARMFYFYCIYFSFIEICLAYCFQ